MREMKREVRKCRESIRSYAEGMIQGINKEFQEKMLERAKEWERRMKTQNTHVRQLMEQCEKVDDLMSDAVDTVSGEAAENISQMVNDKVREFKEEVRQMIDSHLEDRFEEYSAKRRKTEPESVRKRKETSVGVVPSVGVVFEEKEESEMSSTLKAPMEASVDVLSAPGDHVSTSGSSMSIAPKPGPCLEFGSTEY